MPAFDPQLGTEIRETFADPNWSQWIKLHLELTKSDGSLLKMEMLRAEDWVLEQIDYQFLEDEDLQATSPSTAANSSRFLNALPLEAPSVPLRPLFEELHDVRWLMSATDAAAVLVTIALDLPEIGVRGEAVVTGVEPCPAILPGPGKVVLTTFHHASSDLIDLYLSPQPPTGSLAAQQTAVDPLLYPQVSRASVVDQAWERIGVTGNHPLWSEDRHDYVAAMDLRVGERLKNLSGDIVWVQQKLPRPGPTPVYNLEVQDEHVYYIGANGVLAHNAGDKYKGGAHGQTKLPWGDGLESHHMPAKTINGLHPDVGPAIQMSRSDHILTSSHGSRVGSAAYRSYIEDLLTEGEVRKAMAIEIRDVRRAALDGAGDVSKYNDAIRKMLAYARQIRFIPPKMKRKQR